MIDSKIADQLREIYPVSDDCLERLEIFVSRLQEWQSKTNLIASSTLDEIWLRHIADSLQCVRIFPENRNWLDVGSGGGFPGLVIAAVMADHSGSEVTLIESLHKKTAFLRQTNRQMGANAKIITERIENSYEKANQPKVVTARALASLTKLLELTEPWISKGAIGLFHKGREFEEELKECDGLWQFDLINHESEISRDSVLLEIKNLRRISG